MSPWASGRSHPGDRFQQPKVVWRPELRKHGSRMIPPGSPRGGEINIALFQFDRGIGPFFIWDEDDDKEEEA